MGIQIDGTKFVNKGAKAKIVVGSAESTNKTEKDAEKQPVGKRSVNIEPAAKMNISKTGYASLAYDNRPFVVSGKTTEEVYEKLGIISTYDTMRIMDPAAYKKHRALLNEAFNYGKEGNEELSDKYRKEASSYFLNWAIDKIESGTLGNMQRAAYTAVKGMQKRYGDDTEINVSSPDENDARGSMWRFGGEYNILLTPEQMRSYIYDDPEDDSLKALLKSLDESMKELREEKEKNSGSLENLKLGLSVNEDNFPVFCATFKGNTAGDIKATTAGELFDIILWYEDKDRDM